MKPALGTIIPLNWDTKTAKAIQSRPDTWANKLLAKDIDILLGEKDDEKISWFDSGAEVIAERVTRG